MSCNKVEISKTATKSKGREEALCCSAERGKLTTSDTGGASRSRVSSGGSRAADRSRRGHNGLLATNSTAATTGGQLACFLRIGGPGIVPFFNFLQIATRRKREEANKTDVAGGKCESTQSLPTTKLFSIQHFKRCIAQL